MSMYNILFGKNSQTPIILSVIGLKENDIKRFRNCGVDDGNIYIYTRTGGRNRHEYSQEKLTNNLHYLYDHDNYDNTYATFYFSIPKEIQEDFTSFLNCGIEGVTQKFLKWINKTLNRKPTESDLHENMYEKQLATVKKLQISGDVSKLFNGHTVVPLTDSGVREMFKVTEKNDGKFIAYWNFLPYKLKVKENDLKYSFYKNMGDLEDEKVRFSIDIIWEIDHDIKERYIKKFGKEYPKSIKMMDESK